MHFNGITQHIVNLVGVTQHPDTQELLMVMSWCNKGDLRRNLNIIKSYEDALKLVTDIALALTFFHSADLCHYDFHPGNILLNDDTILISDLGLSKTAGINSKTVVGVLPYIAPEVLRG